MKCWQDSEYRKVLCKGYCWKHPPTVPECLSSKLKICCIRTYTGTEHEFEFAKYIMQHSKVLETMKIQSTCLKKDQMLLKLYSCTRGSTTCKLFVDWGWQLRHVFEDRDVVFHERNLLGVILYTICFMLNDQSMLLKFSFYSIVGFYSGCWFYEC